MLKVSEIIYLLDKKKQNLVPCQVIEIISSVTVEGEKVQHVVATPSKKTLTLEKFQGPWFSSTDEAHTFLLNTASELIQRTVNKAIAVAAEHFDYTETRLNSHDHVHEIHEEVLSNELIHTEPVQNSQERVKIDLGDGQVATVTLPPEMTDATKNLTS